MEPCACEPLEIPNSELIARAIFYDFHIRKNGSLKWQAFEANRGDDDLSVMRTPCLSVEEAKMRAKAINAPHKEYRGFALLQAEHIRKAKLEVQDSRIVYCGHADLLLYLGSAPPREVGEPADPAYRALQRDVGERLVRLSDYKPDASYDEDGWIGEQPW